MESLHDGVDFEVVHGGCNFSMCVWLKRRARAADDPRRLDHSGGRIEILDDARPAEFPNLGKTYNIEWTQFQGTAPMTQA